MGTTAWLELEQANAKVSSPPSQNLKQLLQADQRRQPELSQMCQKIPDQAFQRSRWPARWMITTSSLKMRRRKNTPSHSPKIQAVSSLFQASKSQGRGTPRQNFGLVDGSKSEEEFGRKT